MLARCPSCTAQVDEDADVCPNCGWDFIKRIKRPGFKASGDVKLPPAAPPPPPDTPESLKDFEAPPRTAAKPEPKAEPKPAELPKLPPAKGPAAAPPDAGRGLLQFPKIDKGAGKSASPDSPFAIPSLGKFAEPPEAKAPEKEKPAAEAPKEPPKKEKDKPAGPPPARRLEPAPLAAELEEPPAPEMPKTVVRQAAPPSKGKEPSRQTQPPRRTVPPAPQKPHGPMGVYIGLASVAVLAISGAGIYILTRSGEPRQAPTISSTAKPFAPGATGATPSPAPVAPVAPVSPAKPAPPQYNPEPPEILAEPELPSTPKPAPKHVAPAPAPVAPAPRPAAPPPPAAAAPQWSFEGHVYDLINLKPVAGARLTFSAGGKDVSCETDKKGRFKISLDVSPTGNYSLSVSRKGFLDGYVDDTSPPLAELEADERRGIALSGARNDVWVGDVKKTVKRDAFMIPQNLAESAQ